MWFLKYRLHNVWVLFEPIWIYIHVSLKPDDDKPDVSTWSLHTSVWFPLCPPASSQGPVRLKKLLLGINVTRNGCFSLYISPAVDDGLSGVQLGSDTPQLISAFECPVVRVFVASYRAGRLQPHGRGDRYRRQRRRRSGGPGWPAERHSPPAVPAQTGNGPHTGTYCNAWF